MERRECEVWLDGTCNDFVFVGQVRKDGTVYALVCSWDWVALVTDPLFDGCASYACSGEVANGAEALRLWLELADGNGGTWDRFEEVTV